MRIGCVQPRGSSPLMVSEGDGQPEVLLGPEGAALGSWQELIQAGWQASWPRGPRLREGEYRWLPPIDRPQKIFGIGLNYADHARETGASVGEIPVVFNKLSSSVTGHQSAIQLPAISQQVDFEAELVVVLGRGGRNISLSSAREHIFGYGCGIDVSARDWQKGKPGGQWLLGKSFDTFAPLGPWITTADEIPWPVELDIQLTLNGERMQASNTRELIFGIDFLVAHLSKFCTLAPGDLIYTGTPSGVGVARQPPRFLRPGDQLEVTIEKLGTLANFVVASDSSI